MEQITKVCICCNKELPVDDFYKHPLMKDGRLGKCKSCQKENAQLNYRKNRKARIVYEREREKRSERKEKKREYQRRLRDKDPEKYKARTALGNALRDGKIQKQSCSCGSLKVQAHHYDYSQPLDVVWLCRNCHIREHEKEPYTNE